MIKQPTIINMSLNSLKDAGKMQDTAKGDRLPEGACKNSQAREQASSEDIMTFIKIIVEEKHRIKIREQKESKLLKETAKTAKRAEGQEMVEIPISIAESVEMLLRKYLLCRMEERQEQLRNYPAKPKLTHDRSGNIRAFLYRSNKENSQCNQEEEDPDADLFRTMANHKLTRQKLASRNQQLERELSSVREKLREKNNLISKLLSKQTQLRKRYNEEFNRLVRNKNIYNISVNFEKEEEEGEGRNVLNIAGKHMVDCQRDEQDEGRSTVFKSHEKLGKTLAKADSEYLKDTRPRLSKTKNKLHHFKTTKKQLNQMSPASQLLKTINKSLPTECITRRDQEASQYRQLPKAFLKEKNLLDEAEKRPTFELYIHQLESNLPTHKQSIDSNEPKKLQMISKMRDEQFEALEMHGFYNDENLKQIDLKSKI